MGAIIWWKLLSIVKLYLRKCSYIRQRCVSVIRLILSYNIYKDIIL